MGIVVTFLLVVFAIFISMCVGFYFLGVAIRYYVNIKNYLKNNKQTKYVNWLKRTDKEIKDMLK